MPHVVAVSRTPSAVARSNAHFGSLKNKTSAARDDAEWLIDCSGNVGRVHELGGAAADAPCAMLPMDELFLVRLAAARRLWKCLNGRKPDADPTRLSLRHRARLILALRSLDRRLDGATYRDIAVAFFGADRVPVRAWKTHDLRDRTIRAARLGEQMMRGDYRNLLQYPYRFSH